MTKRELGHKIIEVCDESGLGVLDILSVLTILADDLTTVLTRYITKEKHNEHRATD